MYKGSKERRWECAAVGARKVTSSRLGGVGFVEGSVGCISKAGNVSVCLAGMSSVKLPMLAPP